MRVLQIKIENFRGIRNADMTFAGHTLLVGGNNVGKSTVCDALDLVLGPDPTGRNQPGPDVRGSLKLPKWKAAAPQTADVEIIAINERFSAIADCGKNTPTVIDVNFRSHRPTVTIGQNWTLILLHVSTSHAEPSEVKDHASHPDHF